MLKLREIRKAQGLSFAKLSEKSGVPLRTIQDIEKRGDCLVSNLDKLAAALGVSIGDLWISEEEK